MIINDGGIMKKDLIKENYNPVIGYHDQLKQPANDNSYLFYRWRLRYKYRNNIFQKEKTKREK